MRQWAWGRWLAVVLLGVVWMGSAAGPQSDGAGSPGVAWAETVSSMPAPTGYIDDYAGVLSPEAKAQLEATCREVHTKTRAQIFLVTIGSLEGEPVERFANELFAKWRIGEAKTDRGILLLFSIGDRKRWIEVGYGFEGILNDAKVGDIGRAMVPSLQRADYDGAAGIGVDAVAKAIAADAGVTLSSLPAAAAAANTPVDSALKNKLDSMLGPAGASTAAGRGAQPVPQPQQPQQQEDDGGVLGLLSALLPFAFFAFVIFSALRGRGRRGYRPYGGIGGIGLPMIFWGGGRREDGFGGGPGGGFDDGGFGGGGGGDGGGGFTGGDGGASGGGGAGGDW